MDTKDILELISFDAIVAILIMVNLDDALKWLEVLLVITAIAYNIIRIFGTRKKND